ncbi:MAG: ATP-binding protein [Oscillospiraceae bacterium]|nr:ATP-binding protein [Oscillospiraceae bacterium]
MTDNPPYHLWESMLYDVLRTLPHMLLVLYAYRGHWRFGKTFTIVMTALLWIVQMILPQVGDYMPGANMTAIDIIEIVIYLVFIFVMLKEHVGKLVFTVLALSNMGNIMLYGGKCIEGLLFPELAQLRLHYTYALCSLPVLFLELTFAYFLIFQNICSHDDLPDDAYRVKIQGYLWRYLWLVPAVFSLIWFQSLYGSDKSTLEERLNPLNSLYLFAVTAGSMLIYRIIVQLAALYEKNFTLLAENHSLSIQRLQYDSLNERLDNMRRTRHDLRHHAALLKEIRDSGDITALDDLITMYTEQNRLDQPLVRCENETVNVVLALYSETACQNDIAFTVRADIPEAIFADKKDLAVLFGNILENAADACKEVEGSRFIDLTAAYTEMPSGKHCLSIIVKNSCGAVSRDEKGDFHSTKHPGDGIGISSVKRITEKYAGSCSFLPEDGVFTVSVILYG